MGFFQRFGRAGVDAAVENQSEDSTSKHSPRADDSELYCRTETITLPVGDEEVLVYVRDSGSASVLPRFIAELQPHCDTFRSLDEHAVNLCRRFGLTDRDVKAFETHLLDLAERGMLVSRTSLLDRCATRTSTAHQERPPINSTVIVTRNRPELTARCLDDSIGSSKRYGRSTHFVVLDDSPDPDTRAAYKECLRSIAKREGLEIFYAGREEKQRFIDALIDDSSASTLPRSVLEFALFGAEGLTFQAGANRNACLLHTVGDTFFSADDDTRFRIAPGPESNDGLTVTSTADPTEFGFFPDRASALGAVEFAGDDPLAQHERLLGRHLAACMGDLAASAPLDLDGASSRLLTSLLKGKGKVRATMTGIVGDCGSSSRSNYLALQGPGYDRLVASEPGYEVLGSTREVVRAVLNWTITDSRFFMTGAVGFDNAELLPPFCPVQRNSDSVFSATLRSCSDDWLIGHVPWVIEHDPAASRAFERNPCKTPCQVFVPDVVMQCLPSYSPGPAIQEPVDRMRGLGRHLQHFGSLNSRDFDEFVRVAWWRRLSSWISRLENTLTLHDDAPDAWKDDVQECIDEARESILHDDIAPVDLARECAEDQALATMQRLVYRFGELLEHWPDIYEAARDLRENGRTLAVPLR